MRVTRHQMRAAMAQRPIVDFTEPALRKHRRHNRQPSIMFTAVTALFRALR